MFVSNLFCDHCQTVSSQHKVRNKNNWCRTVAAHFVAHYDVDVCVDVDVYVVAVVPGIIINILETTGKSVHNLSQYLHIFPSFDL